MLATESIHKDLNLNKRELAKKLEALTDKIIERGVYVVEKNNDGFYNLLEYTKKQALVIDVPGYRLANNLCNSLNARRKINLTFAQTMIDMYHKLNMDCMYYRHTIENTKDDFKREVVITRLDIAVQQLKNINKELAALK